MSDEATPELWLTGHGGLLDSQAQDLFQCGAWLHVIEDDVSDDHREAVVKLKRAIARVEAASRLALHAADAGQLNVHPVDPRAAHMWEQRVPESDAEREVLARIRRVRGQ